MTSEESLAPSKNISFSHSASSELNIVSIDHCYSKPWSSHPDASNARPLHMLFMDKFPCPPSQEKQRFTELIDVVENDDNALSEGIPGKATKVLMSDYEDGHSDYSDSWEDHIATVRTTWSVLQNRIFAKVIRVLQADRLARLSIQGTKNEPIQRRLQIDKAAKRVRFCFGSIAWDTELILWLHNLMLENLRGPLLTSYLEVLVTLKSKIPSLVEHLIQGTTSKHDFCMEHLNDLLKKNWDPVLASINQQKLKKLPDNPFLLIIPNTPSSSQNSMTLKRSKFWQNQLSGLGKTVNINSSSNSSSLPIGNYVENMLATIKSKILDIKGHFPGRPIILIGWQIGALLATHAALAEYVHGVVCLGFPTTGIYGNRGEIDDEIYTCKTPTLFVIGQHASTCSVDNIEEIREKLRVETGLVLVGGADDQLRMSRAKKRNCNVTQAMVDRCIMEEIYEFFGNILSQTLVKPELNEEIETMRKQRKRKQRDIPSTGSQTGNLSHQLPAKTMKSLKFGSGGTLSFGSQWLMAGANKISKKSSSKKPASKVDGSIVSGKKPMLHLSLPASEKSSDKTGSLSKVSEAAAIASAPELSNLLQSIQNKGQPKFASNLTAPLTNKIVTSTPSSTTITTTTAYNLSQFLASSGFFKTGALVKNDQPCEELESPLKSSSADQLDRASNEQSLNVDELSTKQSQILVRTGISSVPFSIPLTFTVASKVLKSTPLIRVTRSNSDSPQIQQLLTSMPSSIPLIATASSVNQASSSVLSSAGLFSACVTSPSSDIPPIYLGLGSSFINKSSPSISASKSISTANMETLSTESSGVINESETFLKKDMNSITTVPRSVRVDLGQIPSVNSNVMKVAAAPKISLIPAVKQMPVAGIAEKLLLTSPVTGSPNSQFSHFGKLATVSSSFTNKPVASTDSSKALQSNSLIVSSSQILSNLSSTAARLGLKLSTPSSSNTPSKNASTKEDGNSGQTNDSLLAMQKGKISTQSSDYSSNTKELNTNTSTQSDQGKKHQQIPYVALTDAINLSPNSASLIITSGNKIGTGQIVLHCQRATTQSSVSQSSSSSPTTSRVSETLGQVTTLIKSSPATIGDKKHLLTSDVNNSFPSSSASSLCLPSSSTSTTQEQSPLKSSKTLQSSYTATPKPVLPTIASTRTRRIKTPKQYDL